MTKGKEESESAGWRQMLEHYGAVVDAGFGLKSGSIVGYLDCIKSVALRSSELTGMGEQMQTYLAHEDEVVDRINAGLAKYIAEQLALQGWWGKIRNAWRNDNSADEQAADYFSLLRVDEIRHFRECIAAQDIRQVGEVVAVFWARETTGYIFEGPSAQSELFAKGVYVGMINELGMRLNGGELKRRMR